MIVDSNKSRSCLLYIRWIIIKFESLCQTIPILKCVSNISYWGINGLLKPCGSHSLGGIIYIKRLIWRPLPILSPIILFINRLSVWIVYLIGLKTILILVNDILVGIFISINFVHYFFYEVYWFLCVLLHNQIEFGLLDGFVYFLLYVYHCELFVFY